MDLEDNLEQFEHDLMTLEWSMTLPEREILLDRRFKAGIVSKYTGQSCLGCGRAFQPGWKVRVLPIATLRVSHRTHLLTETQSGVFFFEIVVPGHGFSPFKSVSKRKM